MTYVQGLDLVYTARSYNVLVVNFREVNKTFLVMQFQVVAFYSR